MTDTNNDWYKGVDEIAIKYKLPLYKEKNINSHSFVEKAKQMSPDLIITVNFNQILKREIISVPSKGCINTHASLLPNIYRGRAPLNWAVINGEKETGVTVHYIDEKIDAGDIILQKKINIDFNDFIGDVLKKAEKIYPIIVNKAVDLIATGNVKPIPQDLSKGSYYGRRTPKDGQIKWDKTTLEIYNLKRAVSYPYPGAYTYLNANKLLIWKARILDGYGDIKEAKCGQIIDKTNEGFMVKTLDGLILLEDIETNNEINIRKGDVLKYREEK